MKAVTLRMTKLLRSFKRDRDGASAVKLPRFWRRC